MDEDGRLHGLGGLARVLRVLLLVAAVLSAALALLAVRVQVALEDVDPDALVGDDDARDAVGSFLGGMSVFGLVLLTIGVLFVVWMWRAAKNNQSIGRPGALSPGWAVGAWFIPVGSLVIPAIQLQQIWKGADGSVGRDDPGWRSSAGSPRLWLWWVAYVLGQLLTFVGFSVATATDDPEGEVTVAGLVDRIDDVRLGLTLFIAGQVLMIAAAALGAAMVVALTRRQETAAAVLGAGTAGAEPWTTRSAPPAWLPDPTGRYELRWWDGELWTEHVSRRGDQAVDPL